MRFVLLLGSSLRVGVAEHLKSAELSPVLSLVPSANEFDPLAADLTSRLGLSVQRVTKATVAEALHDARATVALCVGWPFIFGPDVLHGPWLLLNSHPCLLPEYRGRNPWAHIILNDERHSGITVHRIDTGIDTGPILRRETFALDPFETYRSLRTKSVRREPAVIEAALRSVADNTAVFTPQPAGPPPWPRRIPEDSRIDPSRPLAELLPIIRASDPDRFPAFFEVDGQRVHVWLSRAIRPQGSDPDSL